MSRRYWLPVIAVVGLLGSVQAQPIRHSASGNTTAQQGQPEPAADTPPNLPISVQNDIHGIASALKAANDKKPSSTDERNARAQEQVAWWTPGLFFLGVLELLITSAGVWLVYRTLFHTKRAAEAAWDAVAETKIANEIAKKGLVESQRAWLDITGVKLTFPTHFREDGLVFGMSISVKNLGNTPGLNAVVETAVIFEGANFKETLVGLREKIDMRHDTTMPAGFHIFPNDVAEYCPRWGHKAEEFTPRIYKLNGRRVVMTTFVVMVGYKIVGDNMLRHTQRAYSINLPVGVELKEDAECALEVLPILTGEIS